MEADWAVEIGARAPRIVVPWEGEGLRYLDLSHAPQPAALIEEIVASIDLAPSRPALSRALSRSNAGRFFTSKCDAWELKSEEVDPLEFDADGPATTGMACYIDLLFRDPAAFGSFDWHEKWMRRTAQRLRDVPLRSARVDFVLRLAEALGEEGFGVSIYVMGCGPNVRAANKAWAAALDAAVKLVGEAAAPRS